jgi:hypothetical protein
MLYENGMDTPTFKHGLRIDTPPLTYEALAKYDLLTYEACKAK